jgi:ankyrin repeat protein
VDGDGSTPLHLAAQHGHVGLVRLLLGHGADPKLSNHLGLAPAHLATCPTIRAILEHPGDEASDPRPEVVEPGPAEEEGRVAGGAELVRVQTALLQAEEKDSLGRSPPSAPPGGDRSQTVKRPFYLGLAAIRTVRSAVWQPGQKKI